MLINFKYGTQFRIGTNIYEVLRHRDDDIELLNITHDTKELLSLDEVLSAYNEKRLMILHEGQDSDVIEYSTKDYSVNQVDIMEKRYKAILPIIERKIRPSQIKEYAENYPEELKPNGSISPASIYRWLDLWYKRENKFDLIPQVRGPKDHRVSKDVMIEASRIILKYGSKAEYVSIKEEYNVLEAEIKNMNLTREIQLEIFSESTYRRIRKATVDTYERDKEHMGKNQADLKHNGVHSNARATRPLECMECDWTPIDCLIVDFELDELYRPCLMYGIDQATGEPMGFNIIFKKEPNAGDWKQLILHCILPKTGFKELYPRVEKNWTAYGVPQSILLDNAKVNDAKEVEEVCSALRIGLRYCEIASGHQKGTVEQALGNLNHKAFQGLVGSLFSNPSEKGQYDSVAKAVVDIKGLYHIAHIAIVDMVANNFNRGQNIQGVPAHLWAKGLKDMKVHPQLPTNRQYLELLFSSNSDTRTVGPRGILLMGHHFFSEELNELRKRLEREGRSREVLIRYGSDLRVIYVKDEFNKRYIEAFIKSGGLERKKLDKNHLIHAELLEYLTNKDGSAYNEYDSSLQGRARLKIEEIQEECKLEYQGIRRRKSREAAANETVASAIKGVPVEQIPGLAESMNISILSPEESREGIKPSKSDNNQDESIIERPKPGALHVDIVDLDKIADSWGSGRKEII
ncbi:hypothetical protein [Paenibacillus roseipurpureus]|uniref:Integrase catalytic domain-containing protein n=1 Tax=Paenibacillus roseopurpureus TaxID=2918901 RepID=A0AA96LJG8_9BACL|nr:hypothetical protein [Paenibacillus sp. MBLB1832]WNR43007.1 hypothetical protein MJB10_18035 [Paenibacillus sp. MBLB1832]